MTALTRPCGVRIYGQPVPQGSMTCVGRGGFHNVQPENKRALERWRTVVNLAAIHLLGKVGGGEPLSGPVGVEITLTVPRPPSVAPGARPWPSVRAPGSGDVDKLARAVLDGLCPRRGKGTRLFGDDAQVVELVARKYYPDSPDAVDVLDKPGVVIRIYPIA